MSELEPGLAGKTKILRKSELLGFPPIACATSEKGSEPVRLIQKSLLDMADDQEGRSILDLLRLDRFNDEYDSLFDTIAEAMVLVRSLGA
jgi:phosphonate transport system substrate-binding protein